MSAAISLVPEKVTLTLYAGDGLQLRITVTDPDGAPIPLDGTIAAQIRAHREDTAPTAVFAVDATDAAAGVVVIALTDEQTAALLNGSSRFYGAWDVQWTSLADVTKTLVQGQVVGDLDVTRV